MKRRNQSALAGVVLVLAIATVAAAQQGGGSPAPSASPDAEAGWVWSPECGCKMRNSILAVTPLKLVLRARENPRSGLLSHQQRHRAARYPRRSDEHNQRIHDVGARAAGHIAPRNAAPVTVELYRQRQEALPQMSIS